MLTYAEVKALATGNALLLEQAEAAAEVARLRLLQSINPQSVTSARRRLADAEQDQYRLRQQTLLLASAREQSARTAVGTDPEAAVRPAARALRERLLLGRSEDPAPVRAPWRGLGIELIPDGGWAATAADVVSLRITLAHRRVDEITLSLPLIRRSDPTCVRAVVTALRRWYDRLDRRIVEVEQAALDAYDDGVAAERVIAGHRFEHADELAAAEARLAEIDTALESSVTHGAVVLA